MHPAEGMLPPGQAVAWSALAASAAVWSDAARVLKSAEMHAVMPSVPIFGLAMSVGEENIC